MEVDKSPDLGGCKSTHEHAPTSRLASEKNGFNEEEKSNMRHTNVCAKG